MEEYELVPLDEDPEKKRCKATRRDGGRCRAYAVPGRRVCRNHGGMSLTGSASPRFSTGKYSRYLPARLLSIYNEMTNDENLLSLRDENMLLKMRIADLISRTSVEDTGKKWDAIKVVFNNLLRAAEDGNEKRLGKNLVKLDELISEGYSDYQAWQSIVDLVERRRKIVETERRTQMDMGRMISVERALLWIGVISDSIVRNSTEIAGIELARKINTRVATDINRLLNKEGEPEFIEVDYE